MNDPKEEPPALGGAGGDNRDPRQPKDTTPCDLAQEVRSGLARGWAFTPLTGKKPFLQGWQGRDVSGADLLAHIGRRGNVGLRTGAVSSVYVIDLDGDIQKHADLIACLPKTVTARTGSGGMHLYFKHCAGLGNTASKILPKVDTRGDGGQVVFVGSVHPDTKKQYRWVPGRSPSEVALAELPAWVVDKILEEPKTVATPPQRPATEQTGGNLDRCLKYLDKMKEAVSGSGGHSATLAACCRIVEYDLSEADEWAAAVHFNDTKCLPRWSERDLLHKLNDARKRAQRGVMTKGALPMPQPQVPQPKCKEAEEQTKERPTVKPHFIHGADLLIAWANDVLHGKPPELWKLGTGFEEVELGPGLVCLLGGAPGAGKTCLAMQWVIDALRADTNLRALVCNVEMAPRTLLDRQLARLTGVNANWIRNRMLTGNESRIKTGLDTLTGIAGRLAFHTGAPTLSDLSRSVDTFNARLLVMDYVQRFTLGTGETLADKRAELDSIMGHVRKFADDGLGVLAVSAVARQKGSSGSNYAGLGLASFRGSSELEYGADSCWTLSRENENDKSRVNFACVKNRHGDTPRMTLAFDGARQEFTVANAITETPLGQPFTWNEPEEEALY